MYWGTGVYGRGTRNCFVVGAGGWCHGGGLLESEGRFLCYGILFTFFFHWCLTKICVRTQGSTKKNLGKIQFFFLDLYFLENKILFQRSVSTSLSSEERSHCIALTKEEEKKNVGKTVRTLWHETMRLAKR